METEPDDISDDINNTMHRNSLQDNDVQDFLQKNSSVKDNSVSDNPIQVDCIPENSVLSNGPKPDHKVHDRGNKNKKADEEVNPKNPESSGKLMSLDQAISKFVKDGACVAMCTCYESLIPFAAGHEIIRQKRTNLTLICPISDILFDQIIGAGCASSVKAAWVGNVITGSGYNFRRAVEKGYISIEDHSNFTISLALKAGSMGIPFLPSVTALGSDLFKTNSGIIKFNCPVSGQKLML